MTTNTTSEQDEHPDEWEDFRAQLLEDPAVREGYERTFHEVVALRQILQRCEAERARAGLSKAELAARAGMNPASLRRLLTAEGSNPSLKTMLSIFEALDLDLTLKPASRRKRKKQAHGTRSVAA